MINELLQIERLLLARFRAGSGFRLRRFDDLSPRQREALSGIQESDGLYGVLTPRDPHSGRTAKVLDETTARFWNALRRPSPLPDCGADRRQTVLEAAQLVMDGILEVESSAGFVCGPEAHPMLFVDQPCRLGGSRLARLSLEAIRYAESLPIQDVRPLAGRIYSFNRVPAHPRHRVRWGSLRRIEAALGLGPRGPLTALTSPAYEMQDVRGWRAWNRPEMDPGRLNVKLYVSPHPDSLTAAFRAAVETFVEMRVGSFKIGKDLAGLLRPDKLVAYFPGRRPMLRVGRLLTQRLKGLRRQGVPFSAELGGDGMLSWGIDPDLDEGLVRFRGLESWRLWISNELAVGILTAKRCSSAPVEPWRFALDRLRLMGVDTETWSITGKRDLPQRHKGAKSLAKAHGGFAALREIS